MNNPPQAECYLMNNSVQFWPAKKSLRRLDDGREIMLYLPANACLLELIHKQPQIVSQSRLIRVGWAGQEDHVTPNTFYQAILTLRQALEDAGLSKNFITTVRRRGLMIHSRNTVTPFNPAAADEGTTPSLNTSLPHFLNLTAIFANYKKNKYTITLLMIFLILSCSIPLVTHNHNFYSSYSQSGTFNGCNVFVSTPSISASHYRKFINKSELTCDTRKWWYISAFHNLPRVTVTRCIHKIENAQNNYCTTDIYYGDNNDI